MQYPWLRKWATTLGLLWQGHVTLPFPDQVDASEHAGISKLFGPALRTSCEKVGFILNAFHDFDGCTALCEAFGGSCDMIAIDCHYPCRRLTSVGLFSPQVQLSM
jgi:hypothetical protein